MTPSAIYGKSILLPSPFSRPFDTPAKKMKTCWAFESTVPLVHELCLLEWVRKLRTATRKLLPTPTARVVKQGGGGSVLSFCYGWLRDSKEKGRIFFLHRVAASSCCCCIVSTTLPWNPPRWVLALPHWSVRDPRLLVLNHRKEAHRMNHQPQRRRLYRVFHPKCWYIEPLLQQHMVAFWA